MPRHKWLRGITRRKFASTPRLEKVEPVSDKTLILPQPSRKQRPGWMMRGCIAIVVMLSLAFAVSQLVLPRWVENQLVAGIRESAGPAELVQVDVNSFPAWKLLQGKVQDLMVDVRQAHINQLKIEAFLVDAHNLVIDTKALRQGKGFNVKAADSLLVSAVITENDLNEYMWVKTAAARDFRIRLSPEWTGLQGSVKVLGTAIQINVKGHFEIKERTRVAFLIDQVEVEQTSLPRFILNALTPRWTVEVDLAQSTFPLEVRNLRVEDGKLFIYGQRPASLPQTQL